MFVEMYMQYTRVNFLSESSLFKNLKFSCPKRLQAQGGDFKVQQSAKFLEKMGDFFNAIGVMVYDDQTGP